MTACFPSYSPPVRALHAGMPGLLSDRQLEVGVSLGGYLYPSVVVPHLSLGLRDGFAFELGGNFNASASTSWAMGWSGARLTLEKHLGIARKLYADFELGTGFGAGGSDGGTPPTAWHRLLIRGLYGGTGLGMRVGHFGFYGRLRLDVASGDRTAATYWPSAIVGVEARIAHHLVFGLAGGYLGMFADGFTAHGWLYQAQLRYFFDVPI